MATKLFINEDNPVAWAAYQKERQWSPDNSDVKLIARSAFTSVGTFLCGDLEAAHASLSCTVIRLLTIPAP